MSYEIKTYSQKQANVIYSAMKRGDIEVPQSVISDMYEMVGCAEIFNTNDAAYIQEFAAAIKNAVDAIFSNDLESAQNSINSISGIENTTVTELVNDEFDDVIIEIEGKKETCETVDAYSIVEMMEEAGAVVANVFDKWSKEITAIFKIENGSAKFEYVF